MYTNTLRGDVLENFLHVRPQALQLGVVRLELELLEDLDDRVQPARGLNRELLRLLFVRSDCLSQRVNRLYDARSTARRRAFASSRSLLSASSEASTGEPRTGAAFAIGVRTASMAIASSSAIVC
jgi:hypothetical protein